MALEAFTLAPERFNMKGQVYLGLRSAYWRLMQSQNHADVGDVQALLNSTSWRITRPLRLLARLLHWQQNIRTRRQLARLDPRLLGDAGWLRYCVPAAHGGALPSLDSRSLVILRETLAFHSPLADFAFAMQGLGSGAISLAGTPEQKALYLPKLVSGEMVTAIAMTEPGAGSDVGSLQTTYTRRDGKGQKTAGTNDSANTDRTTANPEDNASNSVLGKLVYSPNDNNRFRLTVDHLDRDVDWNVLSAIAKPPLASTSVTTAVSGAAGATTSRCTTSRRSATGRHSATGSHEAAARRTTTSAACIRRNALSRRADQA